MDFIFIAIYYNTNLETSVEMYSEYLKARLKITKNVLKQSTKNLF